MEHEREGELDIKHDGTTVLVNLLLITSYAYDMCYIATVSYRPIETWVAFMCKTKNQCRQKRYGSAGDFMTISRM